MGSTEEATEPSSLDFEVGDFHYFACRDLIKFELPENLPCNGDDKENRLGRKPVSEMLTDILHCYKKWLSLKKTVDERVISKVKDDMLRSFIHHVNVEEGIGTQESVITDKVLDEHRLNAGTIYKRTHSKTEKETRNIYEGYVKLEEFSTEVLALDKASLCVMNTEICIKGIHKIMMAGVISKSNTQGGVFSTEMRCTEYRKEMHYYPFYTTLGEWDTIIGAIVDQFNGLMQGIKREIKEKKGEERAEAFLSLFKCAGWFLYKLVSLHPFSDGNGRLCRLLASYTLGLISPFPSPIYNVYSTTKKSDYLEAIYECRIEGLEKPSRLTLIMLESNWAAWKSFIGKLTAK